MTFETVTTDTPSSRAISFIVTDIHLHYRIDSTACAKALFQKGKYPGSGGIVRSQRADGYGGVAAMLHLPPSAA
jgi:hypothetical protein